MSIDEIIKDLQNQIKRLNEEITMLKAKINNEAGQSFNNIAEVSVGTIEPLKKTIPYIAYVRELMEVGEITTIETSNLAFELKARDLIFVVDTEGNITNFEVDANAAIGDLEITVVSVEITQAILPGSQIYFQMQRSESNHTLEIKRA